MKTKTEFFFRRNPYGFGYEILRIISDGVKRSRSLIFHSSDRKQTEDVKKLLDKGKSIDKIKPIQDWKNRILIFKEKHGDRYFLVKTREELEKACQKIFKEREAAGWYSWMKEENEPEAPDFTEESISALPSSMKEDAEKKWKQYKSLLTEYQDIKTTLNLIKMAKSGNAAACLELLEKLRGGEYEKFSFEDPENIDE